MICSRLRTVFVFLSVNKVHEWGKITAKKLEAGQIYETLLCMYMGCSLEKYRSVNKTVTRQFWENCYSDIFFPSMRVSLTEKSSLSSIHQA